MRRSKLSALARSITLLASVGAPCLAQAADLLPSLPPEPLPPPVEIGGGWYLRGDVGVGALDLRKTIAQDVSQPPAAYKYTTLQDYVGDQAFVGAGVGYQFNPWLRFDITGEYRTQTDWTFTAQDTTFRPNGTGYNRTTGKFASIVGLANGYVDLGTWYGVTPFVGAGVGFAHHMFGNVTDQGYGDYQGGFGKAPDRDKTGFAWAAHAGLGYSVTPNLKLELAYRYLNMGSAQTGNVACLPTCNLQTTYHVKDLTSHDVKIGMRWLLGGVEAPMVDYQPMPGPIVRKY
ncbi:outer membrane beta-barrel protein [Methylobacterium sp. 77]|uniref:outer membrane protein n=1 Tax=Methylobacterium sp. 77 TaxID=1101192 RepID=UPI000364A33F|nr:outer membrane beta-barrel protein [Methylobacterium sp. 77]